LVPPLALPTWSAHRHLISTSADDTLVLALLPCTFISCSVLWFCQGCARAAAGRLNYQAPRGAAGVAGPSGLRFKRMLPSPTRECRVRSVSYRQSVTHPLRAPGEAQPRLSADHGLRLMQESADHTPPLPVSLGIRRPWPLLLVTVEVSEGAPWFDRAYSMVNSSVGFSPARATTTQDRRDECPPSLPAAGATGISTHGVPFLVRP
jgi:hypothetical protein